MKRLLIAALIIAGCAKSEAPSSPAPPADETDAAERASLLDVAHGGTVVSRSGETMLEVSALCAIDGDRGTFWMNPPGDLPQSMVVALPARSLIERVGIRTISNGGFTANHVSFEDSTDGKTFTPIITIASADTNKPQWFTTPATEASYLRVTIVDGLLRGHDVRLYSVLADGKELAPPHPGDISGCWSINGRGTRFFAHGARVEGIMQVGPLPIRFDGGFDGRIYRLNWIRGNDYGLALLTVAPDGRALSGIEWHEEAIPLFVADSWFGSTTGCTDAIGQPGEQIDPLLKRVGRFPLFALRFRDDGSLDMNASSDILRSLALFLRNAHGNARFVGHEFRRTDSAANHDFAQRELDALRQALSSAGADLAGVDFIAQGSVAPRQEPVTEAMRAMYSSVDLEIRR